MFKASNYYGQLTRLKTIVHKKDVMKLQQTISNSGYDINEIFTYNNEFGDHGKGDSFTLLHLCIFERWYEGVRLVLVHGADVDVFSFSVSITS